jgi:putative transposase
VSAQRFSIGTQFTWQGQFYEIRRRLPDSQLNLVNLHTNEAQSVAFVQLYQALVVDELHFVVDQQPLDKLNKSGYPDLSDCPPSLRAVAEYRLKLIEPLLELPPPQRKKEIRTLVEQQQSQSPTQRTLQNVVSAASIYRWLRDYLKSGRDIRALLPGTHKRGGSQQSRLQAEVEAIVKIAIDDLGQGSERKSIDYIHREIAVRVAEENQQRLPEEQLAVPSRPTIGRRLQATELERQQEQQSRYQAYGQTNYPLLPLTRVEIDHTRADIIVVDDVDFLPLGRLTLTYCHDAATRYPLGYYLGFEPPSYLAVMTCLYHAMLPKENVRQQYGTQHDWLAYGIPFTLIVDNGREFIGRDLDDACHSLGIVLERMPLKTPHFKAAVERLFGTTNTGFLHTLPGTTFSSPGQRGSYDSLKQACISLNDLDRMMHLFLLDIYAEDFHRGLRGIPTRHWEEATRDGFFPRVPASAAELQILLGRVTYRTIQRYGIELHTLRYNCSALTPLRTRMRQRENRQVKVKYNPADLSRIHVYDPDEKRHIEVPALAQTYTQGLSLWKHKVIRNFVLREQGQVDIVALGQAQRKIQTIVEQSMSGKKLKTRAKVARWQANSQSANMSNPEPDHSAELVVSENDPSSDFDLDMAALEAEGWGVSYDLPDTTPDVI